MTLSSPGHANILIRLSASDLKIASIRSLLRGCATKAVGFIARRACGPIPRRPHIAHLLDLAVRNGWRGWLRYGELAWVCIAGLHHTKPRQHEDSVIVVRPQPEIVTDTKIVDRILPVANCIGDRRTPHERPEIESPPDGLLCNLGMARLGESSRSDERLGTARVGRKLSAASSANVDSPAILPVGDVR